MDFRRCLALTILLAAAPRAGAQSLANGTVRQCSDAASQSDLRRVAAYIRSDAVLSAKPFRQSADLLLEILGERLRGSLSAKAGELPIGEPKFAGFNTEGLIAVSIYRDGRMSAVVRSDSADTDSARIAGTRLAAAMLRQAWKEGDRVYWPDGVKEDSAQFNIHFWKPLPRRDGSERKAQTSYAVAVFSLALPWAEPPSVDSFPKPVYPSESRFKGIQADITLSFVVDTTGFPMISTAHDVLPEGAPVPVGDMADRYREFVRSAAQSLVASRFHPARIAGCKVRERIDFPVTFRLALPAG